MTRTIDAGSLQRQAERGESETGGRGASARSSRRPISREGKSMELAETRAEPQTMHDIVVRPVDAADVPGLLRVFQRMDVAELGALSTTERDVRGLIAEADAGAWVALSAGEIAAFGSLRRLPGVGEWRAQFACLPGAAGAAGAMLDRLAGEAEAGGARSLSLWQIADGVAAPWLRERGWTPTRRYRRMTVDLGGRPRLAPPSAVDVRRARDEADLRLVHRVIEEALAGHWDHHCLDFDEFLAAQARRAGHDPSLWYLASLQGEPAGALVARLEAAEGSIALLGTREQLRGRGVATALLLAAFDDLERRGAARVTLDVDAGNATSAYLVYRRVGMRVQFDSEQWRRALGPA